MKAKSTIVALFFVVATLVIAFVLSRALAQLFAVLRMTDTALVGDRVTLSVAIALLVAAIAGLVTFMWPKTKNYIGAVADELNKVNWPSWAETKISTLVVIVTSVIASMILGVFDITFGLLSDWLAKNV